MTEASDGQNSAPDSSQPASADPREQSDQGKSPSNSTSDSDATERRVARTMLDISHIQKKPARRVAKTLLEQNVPSPEMEPSQKQPSQRYVAKTMLDHSLLFQAVSQSATRQEHKAAEIAKERAQEPVEIIEPIVADKKVDSCRWSWTEPFNAKERYRACALCQAAVYDFSGLTHEQAGALVFQRENLKTPRFYQRGDGKFMTRQCPREVSRRVRLITLSALGVVSLLSALLLMTLLGQSSSKMEPISPIAADDGIGSESGGGDARSAASSPVVLPTDGSTVPLEGSAVGNRTGSSKNSPVVPPGMFHYENGKITRGAMPASAQSEPGAPASVAPAGENEPMWAETSK